VETDGADPPISADQLTELLANAPPNESTILLVGDAVNAPSSVINAVLDAAPELQDMAADSDIEIGSPAAAETLTQELAEAQSMFGMLGSGNMQA